MAITSKHAKMADDEFKSSQMVDTLDQIELPMDILAEERTPTTTAKNFIFRMVKKRRGRVWLDNCCDNVLNPTTKKKERIWLLNGANSIWDSELEHILKDKNRYERARRGMDIPFVDGVCRVREDEELKLEYLRRHKENVGKDRSKAGKISFYEYDPAEEQKIRMQKQLIKIEMITNVKDMPVDKVKKLASFLGIPLVDPDLGVPKTDDGIRTELMLRADTDPVTVQKYMDSKEVEVAYMVKKAILDAKIDLTGQSGNAIWSQGKGFIAKIPSTRKPYEYLTELALTNSDEGRKFKQELEQIVT